MLVAYAYNIIIVIFSAHEFVHQQHAKLFPRLNNLGVDIIAYECTLGNSEMVFRGHFTFYKDIKLQPNKVEAIQKYHLPNNVKQLWLLVDSILQLFYFLGLF